MTTTTDPNFDTTWTDFLGVYIVEQGDPIRRGRSITGEFLIIGKRGAMYRTYRTDGSDTVQFIAESGKFCALKGNYTAQVATLAACAAIEFNHDTV
jgi:hypothetical protein